MSLYAKPKIKLPCYQLPSSMPQSQFFNTYDLQQLAYDQNTAKELAYRYKKHNWLHKSASIIPNLIDECMT